MRRRLVIHIGMHKTGSSSIQRYLSRNRWILNQFGVYYPPSIGADGRRQPKHNALFSAISHEADHGAPHPGLGASEDVVSEFAERMDARGAPISILSAEGLSGERPVFAEALRPLAARFECRIVVFLRRHDHWVDRFYRQMVMSDEVRETRAFPDFLAAPETRAHLNFAEIVGWWCDAFGRDAVQPLVYRQSAEWSPVTEFAKAASLPRWSTRLPYAGAHLNRSVEAAEVEARRGANSAGEKSLTPNRLYGESLGYLSPEDARLLRAHAEVEDEKLRTLAPLMTGQPPLVHGATDHD